ncbi:hypothetical protein TeGR_g8489 [Tetraparma gracilis]|uniref:SGNH hydrolase-type esterase domain-containing protein n=1 Tax=Tetraparma gracilis TaxID=2962635 RepID=A0ABQ6N978_9STRA|nr:hypothetical protein TeGR_g8489 [Tetraparma gracilis]
MRFTLALSLATALLRSNDAVNSTGVVLGSGNSCPGGSVKLTTLASCRAGLRLLGHYGDSFLGVEDDSDWPSGCYYCDNDVDGCTTGAWLNTHSTGSANGKAQPYCSYDFTPLVQGKTVFVGDSDIDYWNASLGLIEGSYNVGYGGYTCQNVLDEADNFIATFAPNTVVLVCGENDIATGRSVTSTLVLFNQVVDKYIAGGARVIYIGTKPEPGTTDLHGQYGEYDAAIMARAEALAGGGAPPLVAVDSSAGFVALGNGAELYDDDDLHLSAAGYGHWGGWLTAAFGAGGGDANCYLWRSGECVGGKEEDGEEDLYEDGAAPRAALPAAALAASLAAALALQ